MSIDERDELQYEDSALKSIDSTFLNQDLHGTSTDSVKLRGNDKPASAV